MKLTPAVCNFSDPAGVPKSEEPTVSKDLTLLLLLELHSKQARGFALKTITAEN